MVAVLSSMT
uniref:Uncharacterized protein n=1 Tax=Arundo donax TaxID=35708 RepID=A0A0A9HPP1_ARUDO